MRPGGRADAIDMVCRRIRHETLTALTQALVAQPSHTSEGEEAAVEVLARFLEQAGIHCVRHRVDNWG